MSRTHATSRMHVSTQSARAMMLTLSTIVRHGESEYDVLQKFSKYLHQNLRPAIVESFTLVPPRQNTRRAIDRAAGARLRKARAALIKKGVEPTPSSATTASGDGSRFGGPVNINQSFYAPDGCQPSTGSMGGSVRNTENNSAWAPKFGEVKYGPPQDAQTSFYMSHKDPKFPRLYPHADLNEYEMPESEKKAAREMREVEDAVSRPSRAEYVVQALPSSPPGYSSSVGDYFGETGGVDVVDQSLDHTVQVEKPAEVAVKADEKEDVQLNDKPSVDAAACFEVENPVAGLDQRKSADVSGNDDSALVLDDTSLSASKQPVHSAPTQDAVNTNFNRNFSFSFSQPAGDNTIDDTQLTHDSTYASQLEAPTDRQSFELQPRAPAARKKKVIADTSKLRRSSRLAKTSGAPAAENVVLGKRARGDKDVEEGAAKKKVLSESDMAALSTSGEEFSKL
ncbi:hypothetical protein BDW02DRAFT_602889 [Decorospora gaudefroyi]|uniref:Uncharacterized protein n=1 Tax=Decorospora gaudefroyi TaxID=184978 RepID=A0A6A5K373_9PLEO|nr:hypothetical protein BDW02DRAFT_602889 [Decorospora gaudefroyi]